MQGVYVAMKGTEVLKAVGLYTALLRHATRNIQKHKRSMEVRLFSQLFNNNHHCKLLQFFAAVKVKENCQLNKRNV